MAIIPGIATSQEKLAGALSYLFFPIPMMMDKKTEFTMFHAKQSFALTCISIIAFVISFFPIIGIPVQFIISIFVFFTACWSAYQAYNGNKFVIPGIAEYTNLAITKLNISQFFQV